MLVTLTRERKTVAQSADASTRQSRRGRPGELAEQAVAVHAGGVVPAIRHVRTTVIGWRNTANRLKERRRAWRCMRTLASEPQGQSRRE